MKVEFSDEAKRQVREANAWWRRHRDSKAVFIDELREARKALRDGPKYPIYAYIAGEPVRRILLEKTRYHIYYVVLEREALVRIVALWNATRERGPSL